MIYLTVLNTNQSGWVLMCGMTYCRSHRTGDKSNKMSTTSRASRNAPKDGGICKTVCGSVPVAVHERKLVNIILFLITFISLMF